MPVIELISLALLLAIGWLWLDSLKAREAGVLAARKACAAEDLLFLDETVSIESVRFARDDDQRLKLRRVYSFEYSDTGDNRREGSVSLIGTTVVLLNLYSMARTQLKSVHTADDRIFELTDPLEEPASTTEITIVDSSVPPSHPSKHTLH